MKKKRNYKTTTTTELDYMKVIKITIGVLIVLGLVYFGTAILSGEIKFNKAKKKEEETTFSYKNIIAGETFNRSPIDYYVLFYQSSDTYADYYSQLVSMYNAKSESLPFYFVDLDEKINSEYLISEDDTNNYDKPSNISNLKVKNPTIIRIRNKQVFDFISGKEEVLKFFNN